MICRAEKFTAVTDFFELAAITIGPGRFNRRSRAYQRTRAYGATGCRKLAVSLGRNAPYRHGGMDYGIIESVLRIFVRRICSGRKSAVRDLSSEETRISHGMVRAQLA